ncbi:spore cortex formation protein SpoVR/YcgB (stage V sporulation) [Bradyrhizobium sp. LB7.2]
MTERLFEGADWDFHILQRITDACEEVATKDLGLDVYPNQIEVITAEQMLDAYSSVGMPLFYKHWSFRQAVRVSRGVLSQGTDGARL